ncbi:MAG: hypothetical protein Q4E03_05330 [Trueperella sp.]|nr:hypothetical protein [Trueperella sp.]
MSIELAACSELTNLKSTVAQLDMSLASEHTKTASVGIDLSLLGANCTGEYAVSSPLDQVDYRKLITAMRTAHDGGIDFVSLNSTFATHSLGKTRDSSLDGVHAAAKIAEFATGGICVETCATPEAINIATDLLAKQTAGWAGITIPLHENSDFAALAAAAADARAAGIPVTVVITNPKVSPERAKLVVSIADSIRLRVSNPHEARGARFALRAAAKEANRDLPVMAEIGIVISATVPAAEERALLIEEINGCEIFPGLPKVIGTVYDVADTVESWVGLGASDGVVLVPGSLPTDLASVLRGVLPLLKARSIVSE